jgi:hypothetical protein
MSAPAWASTGCADGASDETCATATGGGFEMDSRETKERADRDGSTTRTSAAQPAPSVITQKTYVPTCSGNTPYNNGVLCTAAVEACPTEGDVQFWVYAREYNVVERREVTPYTRAVDPSTVCLGPDDPVIDPRVAIPGLVQRDFKSVVVVKGVAEVSPAPDTLVNIPTVFETSTPASYDIPLTLLGQSVVITATAESYTWHFGDGVTATSTATGGRVEHEYRRAASRQAYVVISWSGSFSINGGASQAITGRATTTGAPIAVEVKQARSELVRD